MDLYFDSIFGLCLSIFVAYFVGMNFYMVGLYLDYIFKIYYHLNSSLDRMVYRLIFGASFTSILFVALIFMFGEKYLLNFSFLIVTINLIFSVYPTSARVIHNNVSSNLGELKHLDNLEKVLLGMFGIYFFFSVPDISFLSGTEYKSLLTKDLFHQNFKFVESMFYFINLTHRLTGYFYFFLGGLYYLIIYSFFRFFYSRRVSLIGILAIITNWNLSKLVYADITTYGTSLYLLAFIWGLLWVNTSKSYRTNLFFGMILSLSAHHPLQISMTILFLGLTSIFLTSDVRTTWAKIQSLKYMSLGVLFAVALAIIDIMIGDDFLLLQKQQLSFNLFFKKSYNILSALGAVVFTVTYFLAKKGKLNKSYSFLNLANYLLFTLAFSAALFILSQNGKLFDISAYTYFLIVLFSLPALELVLNSLGLFHRKRNLIFFLYILFTILDSHFESRIKTLIRIL